MCYDLKVTLNVFINDLLSGTNGWTLFFYFDRSPLQYKSDCTNVYIILSESHACLILLIIKLLQYLQLYHVHVFLWVVNFGNKKGILFLSNITCMLVLFLSWKQYFFSQIKYNIIKHEQQDAPCLSLVIYKPISSISVLHNKRVWRIPSGKHVINVKEKDEIKKDKLMNNFEN